jgi:predicted lipid-binding transport protein (Tim44 family)
VVIILVVIVVVAIILARMNQASKNRARMAPPPAPPVSQGGEQLDRVLAPALFVPKARNTWQLLEHLAQRDASLEPEDLRAHVIDTFYKLQRCWHERAYESMKSLLVPSLYTQHCNQLQSMVQNHEINVLDDLRLERVDIIHLSYLNLGDTCDFTALITARARDYYLDDRSGAWLRGDRAPTRFQEFWTFRRQGNSWLLSDIEQTLESDLLREENQVDLFTPNQLEEIYQGATSLSDPAEAGQGQEGHGLKAQLRRLAAQDRLWGQGLIKERVRDVFTHLLLAQEAGNPDAVRADEMTPEAAAAEQDKIRAWRDEGVHVQYRNLCVRKVEVIAARRLDDPADDEFTACIYAHAQKTLTGKGGALIKKDPDVRAFEAFWTFGRLDGQWKLKEVLPPEEGQRLLDAARRA